MSESPISEYVIKDHIRVILVKLNEYNYLIIDLPALPWCFSESKELSVGKAKLFYAKLSNSLLNECLGNYLISNEVVGTLVNGVKRAISIRLKVSRSLTIDERVIENIYDCLSRKIINFCSSG
ncbi:MAG: hypothetical protein DRO18_07435 [Thermoprotei archaeon]|nr:MAG: hypothetical protein DRO18_07435 [Thermoprotei archaeon]